METHNPFINKKILIHGKLYILLLKQILLTNV